MLVIKKDQNDLINREDEEYNIAQEDYLEDESSDELEDNFDHEDSKEKMHHKNKYVQNLDDNEQEKVHQKRRNDSTVSEDNEFVVQEEYIDKYEPLEHNRSLTDEDEFILKEDYIETESDHYDSSPVKKEAPQLARVLLSDGTSIQQVQIVTQSVDGTICLVTNQEESKHAKEIEKNHNQEMYFEQQANNKNCLEIIHENDLPMYVKEEEEIIYNDEQSNDNQNQSNCDQDQQMDEYSDQESQNAMDLESDMDIDQQASIKTEQKSVDQLSYNVKKIYKQNHIKNKKSRRTKFRNVKYGKDYVLDKEYTEEKKRESHSLLPENESKLKSKRKKYKNGKYDDKYVMDDKFSEKELENILPENRTVVQNISGCEIYRLPESQKVYKCLKEMCQQNFTELLDFKEHLKRHKSETDFYCCFCSKFFKKSSALSQHIPSHDKCYVCAICHQKFPQLQYASEHAKSHVNGKPFECTICNKTFTSAKKMKSHNKIHIIDRQLYQCFVCGNKYKTKLNLRSHVFDHEIGRNLVCSICNNKDFHHFYIFCGHMQLHDVANECGICKIPVTSKEISNHMKVHANIDGKYQCIYCLKHFAFESLHDNHVRIHSKEKPYKCELCPRNFSALASKKSHMRLHAQRKSYQCSKCNTNFIFLTAMKRHEINCLGINKTKDNIKKKKNKDTKNKKNKDSKNKKVKAKKYKHKTTVKDLPLKMKLRKSRRHLSNKEMS